MASDFIVCDKSFVISNVDRLECIGGNTCFKRIITVDQCEPRHTPLKLADKGTSLVYLFLISYLKSVSLA